MTDIRIHRFWLAMCPAGDGQVSHYTQSAYRAFWMQNQKWLRGHENPEQESYARCDGRKLEINELQRRR
jgi:hypothetical protein